LLTERNLFNYGLGVNFSLFNFEVKNVTENTEYAIYSAFSTPFAFTELQIMNSIKPYLSLGRLIACT